MNTTIWNILSDKIEGISIARGIEIPMIQRDYAHGRTNPESTEIRRQFLHNIKSYLLRNQEDSSQSLELDFVYGYVEKDRFIPLDGQQRLTTLFLIHWYLILKNNRIDEHKKELNRFKYQMRQSTLDFIFNLVNKYKYSDYLTVTTVEVSLSDSIKNKNWYFSKWKYDSSVQSMLTMLDDIDNIFGNAKIDIDNIIKIGDAAINFNFLNISELGLSDDLYIKMNARGKTLTSFENLKAELGKYIKQSTYNDNYSFYLEHSEGEKNVDVETYLITKIDTEWTDYFWSLRDTKTNLFDDKLLNILSSISLNYLAIHRPEHFDEIRDKFYKKDYLATFYQFKNLELLIEDVVIDYINFLDFLVLKDGPISVFLQSSQYFNKLELFQSIAFNANFKPNYVERIRYYGILKFMQLAKNQPDSLNELLKFERLLYNLTVPPFHYNNSEDYVKSLVSLNSLFEDYGGDIFSTFMNSKISGFDTGQILEEKIKVLLILKGENWQMLIEKVEKDNYLNGQINFLLSFSGIQAFYENNAHLAFHEKDGAYFNALKELYEKYLLYFDNKGLKQFEDEKFRVALLSIGVYLINAKNWSFLINNNRDASWKRFFKEVFSNRGNWQQAISYLQTLFSETSLDKSAVQNLKEIIKNHPVPSSDWRYDFIKNPEMIGYRNNYFIRSRDEWKDIHLLNASKYSNNAIEIQTYLLSKKLNEIGLVCEIDFIAKFGRSGIVSIAKKRITVLFNFNGDLKFLIKQRTKIDLTFDRLKDTFQYIQSIFQPEK